MNKSIGEITERTSRIKRRIDRKILWPLISPLYVDYDPDYRNSIFLAGVEKSGTTWVLAIIVNYKHEYRMEDFLNPFKEEIEKAQTRFEKFILRWCIQNYVPLKQFKRGEIHLAFYEDFCEKPKSEIDWLVCVSFKPVCGVENRLRWSQVGRVYHNKHRSDRYNFWGKPRNKTKWILAVG